MRSGVLLDTGPLVAYLHPRDLYHDWAVDAFDDFNPPVITCEPVLTEACFLVARTSLSATRVLEYVARGGARIGLRLDEEMVAIRALMERYENVPMSLADACLVRLAEIDRIADLHARRRFCDLSRAWSANSTLISPAPRHLHEP